jgi:hypothetical protein
MQTGFREVFRAKKAIFMESTGLTVERPDQESGSRSALHSDALRAGMQIIIPNRGTL